jgi:hypothetical protein
MAPQWFPIDAIPYDKMWPDDRFWLPLLLQGLLLGSDLFPQLFQGNISLGFFDFAKEAS